MRRNRLAVATLWIMLLLTAAFFIACGGSGVSLPDNEAAVPLQGDPAVPEALQLPDSGTEQVKEINRVLLRVPSLVGLQSGDEFNAILSMEAVEEIHQGVLRLQFDAQAMSPVEAVPGEMLPGNMIRIASLDKPGYIPLAFTALPDERNITPGSGDLMTIRFRLNVSGSSAGRISFSPDSDFLQLRDRRGRHVSFEVETSAGGSNAR